MDKFPVSPAIASSAWIDLDTYEKLYAQSVNDPEAFWGAQGKTLDWIKPYSKVKSGDFTGDVNVKWFEDGTLNACVNCVDRHLPARANQTAIIWEPDDPNDAVVKLTYQELHDKVCAFANVLKRHGVHKGDRVVIYLPMIPEAAISLLACARIGAVHSVVFGGFSPHALRDRILDSGAKLVITSDEGVRDGREVRLKSNMDEALASCPDVAHALVVKHTGNAVAWQNGRDLWLHEELDGTSTDCPPAEMNAEDPLFILYTSGSTGKPKGVVHTTGGYLLYASLTHKLVFDYHEGEVFWCSADVGWVTGHSYVVYGPLANGATTLMFEGVPHYPDASRFWQVIDKHNVNIFYTAPTAIRALMREGDEWVEATSRKSLRLLGTVGEPINPEAWLWYHRVVGEERCPVIDTWWQTETGGHMIAPLAGATALKPGSATRPFFGVKPVVVDASGNILEGACEGILCIDGSWPGMMRTIWRDHERFLQTYFNCFKGLYFTGDGCRRDEDGYYWITGRIDDVLNVSGHRLSTAEIESACVSHHAVAEAAVVGCPCALKGQAIYVFVTPKQGFHGNEDLLRALRTHVRNEIGPIATPEFIHFTPGLPKTRSGKIMRRILRKIVAGEADQLGDVSTLADPSIVELLIKNRVNGQETASHGHADAVAPAKKKAAG
ncbi:MAG: acetate--CoA ligase [Alphaproteobacteria bacterium]|nr:acetate--CoA ligase [Alphaproteobacteria bacterium]